MFDSIEKIYGEPLSKHSSFKIGGDAKAAYFPRSKEEFIFLLDKFSREGERFFVVGNGSNLLFDDLGFDGSVIFTKNMSECRYMQVIISNVNGSRFKIEGGICLLFDRQFEG